MNTRQARHARQIAVSVLAFRQGNYTGNRIPIQLMNDPKWRQAHLFRPVARKAIRRTMRGVA